MIQKTIAATPDVTIEEKPTTFPKVDPNKIELPPALGGQYNEIRNRAEIESRR